MIPSVVALAARGAFAQEQATSDAREVKELGVTLRQELASLGHYANMRNAVGTVPRDVQLEVAPSALEARVPTLFLQLLVENVLWQMHRTGGAGTVQLSAQREGDELHLGMRIVMPFQAGG